MKSKNLAAVISFLIVAVSCSMEDDVLNSITKDDPENNSNTEVYLSFNIDVNDVSTRAGEITDGNGEYANTVSSCSVILFENDNVIGVYDDLEVTSVGGVYTLNDAKFLVKTGRKYEVYVIGDTEQTFKGCTGKAQVEAKAFGAADLTRKVKFGKAEVNNITGGSSSALAPEKQNINIQLSNLTAQICLMDVVGEIKEGSTSGSVQLTKVELLNKNTAYTLKGNTDVTEMALSDEVKTLATPFAVENRELNFDTTKEDIAGFASFPNNDKDQAVQVRLTFKVGSDEKQTRIYTINRPDGDTEEGRTASNTTGTSYVDEGYIYQLYAKVKLTGDEIECTLTCYTRDWLHNEVEVITINNTK